MLKIFLIYSHSLPVSASLFLQSLCLQKCAISLVAMAVHGFFYKQTQLPMGLKLKKNGQKYCSGSDCQAQTETHGSASNSLS